MKRQDDDFDATLRRHAGQFRAPSPAQLDASRERIRERLARALPSLVTEARQMTRTRSSCAWRLGFAAVAVGIIIALVVTTPWRAAALATIADGSLYVGTERQLLQRGRAIDAGQLVRSNGGQGGVIELADDSRIEMRSKSELSLERADDGLRIRLNRGGIIVNAAKQRAGHLYVQTKDVTVSVVGTVFLVNADEEGSRVAVIEGEVRVLQGATVKTLLPGEQVTTNSSMRSPPVRDAIAWSRNAPALTSLLQQAAIARPLSAQVPVAEQGTTFEAISIRPSLAVGGGGRGTGTGIRRRNPRASGEPCGVDREPLVDGRRFDASETTVHALITWAYGLNCSPWRGSDYLSGGPQWLMDDGYEIQATIPMGAPAYTNTQLRANRAPELQRMLQNLLADRFKLMLRREQKDLPVYRLTRAPGGPKLLARESGQPGAEPVFAPLPYGLMVWRESDTDCCPAVTITPEVIRGRKQSMASLATALTFLLGRPVLERTGLTDSYNFSFPFEPIQPPNTPPLRPRAAALPPANPRSIFAAIEEDLGLRLEPSMERLEVFVIERVERPSQN